jgi:hypothetical protein
LVSRCNIFSEVVSCFYERRGLDIRKKNDRKEDEVMPAVSKKQRIAMAIAEHHPEKLYSRNRSLKKMDKSQLHDFAKTKEKNLPYSKEDHQFVKRMRHKK